MPTLDFSEKSYIIFTSNINCLKISYNIDQEMSKMMILVCGGIIWAYVERWVIWGSSNYLEAQFLLYFQLARFLNVLINWNLWWVLILWEGHFWLFQGQNWEDDLIIFFVLHGPFLKDSFVPNLTWKSRNSICFCFNLTLQEA